MQRVTTSLIRLASLALAALLIAMPAAAQQVDSTGEKELIAAGQKVDKVSASADSKHVTDKIVEQWKDTRFKFDATDTSSRQLNKEDVQNLRRQKLGYGEISILLALAAQPGGTKSVNEILAMRQTDKMGWGNIAKALGYKSLGSVKQNVNATEAAIEKVSAGGKAEKSSPEKVAKPDKPEKTEKFDKPERIRVEKPERVEKPGR